MKHADFLETGREVPRGTTRCLLALMIPLVVGVACWQSAAASAAGLLTPDAAKIVSRADITFDKPASRTEEGLPVGNGRMGSLLWTSPSAMHFQINRVDVFAQDSTTTSFPAADRDYGSGCGFVDINLSNAGDDVFAGSDFRQHLSVYDGLMTVQGGGVTARVLGWHARDVMAVEIDDQRAQPEAINIDLRMLRYVMQVVNGRNAALAKAHTVLVETAEHSAASKLDVRGNRILLTQEFRERKFYDSSAVAIGVVGRASKARYLNDSTVQLSAAPGKGKFVVLISSAASFDQKQDTGFWPWPNWKRPRKRGSTPSWPTTPPGGTTAGPRRSSLCGATTAGLRPSSRTTRTSST